MTNRKGFILWALIILAFISTPAVSGTTSFVSPEQVDLTKLLAPPPSDKSASTKAEILELVQIQKASTPEEKSSAKSDDKYSIIQFAQTVLGPKFNADDLPLTESLLRRLGNDAIAVFVPPKEKWNKSRPFILDSEVKSCSADAAGGSYPSGHSTFGYLAAIVLADMIPEKKAEFFERADQNARNRMVCGVHYRSDVEAGRIAGTVIAAFAMQSPRFRKEFEEARKEVRKIFNLP
jgi:acid phosphatase (class A)